MQKEVQSLSKNVVTECCKALTRTAAKATNLMRRIRARVGERAVTVEMIMR